MLFDWASHTVWFFVEDIEVEQYVLPIRRGFLGIPMQHSQLPAYALRQNPYLRLFRIAYRLLLGLNRPIIPRLPIKLGFEELKWHRTPEIRHHRSMLRTDHIQVWVDNSPIWSTRPSCEIAGESASTLVEGKCLKMIVDKDQLRDALLPESFNLDC